jgi:hypothetical protein
VSAQARLALRPPVSTKASAIARHGGIAPTRFERLSNDNYFTIDAPWLIPALLAKVKIVGPVLEPASGKVFDVMALIG